MNVQSIFFNKEKYTLENSIEYLSKNNLINYKRVNEDKYYFRFTYQSRIKLQNQNYIKQIKFLDDNNIKIEHYIKPDIKYDFIVKF
jgi:hypothetical protein